MYNGLQSVMVQGPAKPSPQISSKCYFVWQRKLSVSTISCHMIGWPMNAKWRGFGRKWLLPKWGTILAFHEGTVQNNEKPQSGWPLDLAMIQTKHITNTNVECYHYTNLKVVLVIHKILWNKSHCLHVLNTHFTVYLHPEYSPVGSNLQRDWTTTDMSEQDEGLY